MNTTQDMLYELQHLLRRKNRDSHLHSMLKNYQPRTTKSVLLFMNATTPPNPFCSSGGFDGDSYFTEREKGRMQICSFLLLFHQDKIMYFDVMKTSGPYRAITGKDKKGVQISKRLVKDLVKPS